MPMGESEWWRLRARMGGPNKDMVLPFPRLQDGGDDTYTHLEKQGTEF